MAMIAQWLVAIRPKTLVASVSPVLLGTVYAMTQGVFSFPLFLFTLMTALSIQITTNLANDYWDYLKGADTPARQGPVRVMQAGFFSLAVMKRAVFGSIILTIAIGSYLVISGGWSIALLLFLSVILAVLYTAGPYPLAYLGLGELFVFPFFGPVAVGGTVFLQMQQLPIDALIAGIGPGAIATAILIVNNVRDLQEDRLANKKTLVVRFGNTFGKIEYLICLFLPLIPSLFFAREHPFILLTGLIPILSIPLIRHMYTYKESKELNLLLAHTAQLLWLYTLLFSIGFLL